MKEDVLQFVQQCVDCQTKKLVREKTKQKLVITDSPPVPFFKTAMDIVGPMPITRKGNQYCLTFQCLFTRFAICIPLPDQTAATIADAFIKRVICVFGAPNGLLTDCGQNFLSNLMKRIAKRFRIKQFRTTSFHPQSNGLKERQHSSLNEYLKIFTNKYEDWDEWCEMAMLQFNTSRHETTHYTPYELMFARIARVPSAAPPEPKDLLPTYADYMSQLINRLNALHEIAREKIMLL